MDLSFGVEPPARGRWSGHQLSEAASVHLPEGCWGSGCGFCLLRGEPAFHLPEEGMIRDRGGSLGTGPRLIHPALHVVGCEEVSLPPDGQRPFEDLKSLLEGQK